MSAQTDWLAGIGSSLVAAGVIVASYLTGRRKTSGTIKTSEAVDLWKESADIRKSLTERVASLEKQVDEMQKEINGLRDKSVRDDAELAQLRGTR